MSEDPEDFKSPPNEPEKHKPVAKDEKPKAEADDDKPKHKK